MCFLFCAEVFSRCENFYNDNGLLVFKGSNQIFTDRNSITGVIVIFYQYNDRIMV